MLRQSERYAIALALVPVALPLPIHVHTQMWLRTRQFIPALHPAKTPDFLNTLESTPPSPPSLIGS